MISQDDKQAIIDQEDLKILSVAHLIEGCLYAFSSLFGLLYAAMGIVMALTFAHLPEQEGQPPPELFSTFFVIIGGGIFTLFMAAGVLKILCARNLWRRRSRWFCFVVSALSCIAVPYGTAIGVFTILVLLRPSVTTLFSGAPGDSESLATL